MNVTANDIIRATKNHLKITYTHICLDTEMEMENLRRNIETLRNFLPQASNYNNYVSKTCESHRSTFLFSHRSKYFAGQ
jgi:hypothetical protein